MSPLRFSYALLGTVIATAHVSATAAPRAADSPSARASASATHHGKPRAHVRDHRGGRASGAERATRSASHEPSGKANDRKPAASASASARAAAPSDDPPPELTGSLPQARLADRKPADKKPSPDKAPKPSAEANEPTDVASRSGHLPPLPALPAPQGGTGRVGGPLHPAPTGPRRSAETRKGGRLRACLNPAVSFTRLGQAADTQVVLTTCTGAPAPGAVDQLSVLARPYDVPAPAQPESILAISRPRPSRLLAVSDLVEEVSPGIRRVDPGLVQRAQAISDHFHGRTITIVSGYRPASTGSPHQAARAMDIRLGGVTNEALVEYCRTLNDTGCGYYPNSYFVHVDVRSPGTGHVYWIDISGPGEKPVYVKQWPLPAAAAPKTQDRPEIPEAPATTDEGAIGHVDERVSETASDEPGSTN